MIRITQPFRFMGVIGVPIICIMLLIIFFILKNGSVQKSGEFTVESGQGAKSVWGQLVEQGYFKRTFPLRYTAWRQDAAASLKAGTYQLEVGESAHDVVARMAAGDVVLDEFSVTFPEGFTTQQIAARTSAKGIGTEESFLAAATPTAFVEKFPFLSSIPAGRSLEGYLFPDTYKVFEDDTPADVIERMLANFSQKVPSQLQADIAQSGRSLDDIIIMASIIEREVIHDEDMALISGILWKRIENGEGLYADATIRYALNKWDGALTVQDLAVDSPYNSRKYRGLPPGPISNPGIRAIMAALHPQASEYYYYLSTPSGETIFSKTNEEHNLNKAKYLR